MGTLDEFQSNECPRCGLRYFYKLGDQHHIRLPITTSATMLGQGGVDCYVKVCKNCAYVDLYAKVLIDSFGAEQRADGSLFGRVSRAGGRYLVSYFVKYKDPQETATDFTVPLTAEQWFALRISADRLTDDALVDMVYAPAYQRAFRERVGEFPEDFGMHLRQIIREYRE